MRKHVNELVIICNEEFKFCVKVVDEKTKVSIIIKFMPKLYKFVQDFTHQLTVIRKFGCNNLVISKHFSKYFNEK